jgi:hypothetical protein
MDSSLRVPTLQSGGAEMHGLIFAELKKYAETKPGMGSWHVLLKNAGLETKTTSPFGCTPMLKWRRW